MAVTAKKILVVDDDAKIRTLLRRCLESDGYLVTEAHNAQSVRAAFAAEAFDLVTLDLNLGAEDGLDIARELQRDHDVPIFMVTGKDDVIDRVVGLELGPCEIGFAAQWQTRGGGPRTPKGRSMARARWAKDQPRPDAAAGP